MSRSRTRELCLAGAVVLPIGVLSSVGFAGLAAGGQQPDVGIPPLFSHRTLSSDVDIGGIVIGEIERRLIRSYYQRTYEEWNRGPGKGKGRGNKNAKNLPPGLAKRGELPPGLAKQLVRNGHLPPGLEGRDLPPDLLRQLPALPQGYRYLQAGDKVMLVKAATNAILDVLTVAAIDLID